MVSFFTGKTRKSSSPQLCLQYSPQDVSSEHSSAPSTPLSEKDRLEMVPGGGEGELAATPISSKARQKKFHRHFKSVGQDERVLNYYSCALVADILLQGHLYITKNYFAFYSNVFGYVTKLLIPTSSVVKVTKEKTAYIIPNAVGITTEDEKHVFGSLLSRDSTYKLMHQVWSAAVRESPSRGPPSCLPSSPHHLQEVDAVEGVAKEESEEAEVVPSLHDDESSVSGSESNLGAKLAPPPLSVSRANQTLSVEVKSYQDVFSQTVVGGGGSGTRPYTQCYSYLSSVPRPTLLLSLSTLLLLLLFGSATVLLFRIASLQDRYTNPLQFSSRSLSEVQQFLDSNLEQISKVRESLESLSVLIEGGAGDTGKQRWTSLANNNNLPQHNS